MNDRILKALNRENHGRPPVWLMRQAGRYLPEYRKMREKYSFMQMCRTPEIVAEITQQPLRRFGFDAAILFSDILVVPDALQMGLSFVEGKGPLFERALHTAFDIDNLPKIDITQSLDYVFRSIRLLNDQLKVPLLGFAGAPFTVASYMIEGGASRELRKTKKWMLEDPDSFHRLLQLLTDHTVDYLTAQSHAGVAAVQVFESWANMLAYPQFLEFSLSYLKKIVDTLKARNIPVVLFARGSSLLAQDLAALQPTALSIDWNGDLSATRKMIGGNIVLQGNLDPEVLLCSPKTVKKEVQRILTEMKGDPSYIFNLGHGITPETPLESVQTLVETIHDA
jgi:uroporphyrinogen decarboxylase